MSDQTTIDAYKLADIYINRLSSGYYKSYREMRNEILYNVVNSEYSQCSNYFIDRMWERIKDKIHS